MKTEKCVLDSFFSPKISFSKMRCFSARSDTTTLAVRSVLFCDSIDGAWRAVYRAGELPCLRCE